MGKTIVGLVAMSAVLVVALSGCASQPAAAPTPEVQSTSPKTFEAYGLIGVSLSNVDVWKRPSTGESCTPSGGFSDLTPGSQVKVSSGGETVALAELSPGVYGKGKCVMSFHLEGVPAGQKFYSLSIGHRTPMEYTEDKLKFGPNLSIGD